MQQHQTTAQIGRDTLDRVRATHPGMTFDEAVRKMLLSSGVAVSDVSAQGIAEVVSRLFHPKAFFEAISAIVTGSEQRLARQIAQVTGAPPAGPVDVFVYRKSVPAATKDDDSKSIASDGRVVLAFVDFPPGPNFLVEVRLNRERGSADEQVIPSQTDTFLVGDSSLQALTSLNIEVKRGDVLRTEWWNYDGGNAHTVPLTLVVVREGG